MKSLLANRIGISRENGQYAPRCPPVSSNRVHIWMSELMWMCRNAYAWATKETGGWLYGWWTHRGDPVVAFVVPPGPNARHETANFTQDFEHQTLCDRFLFKHYGLVNVGREHSHHGLGLSEPSGFDVSSAGLIADKNDIARYLDLIVTFDGRRRHAPVNVAAFLHTDPVERTQQECPVRVIPGISQVRTGCLGTKVFPSMDSYHWEFPQERIQCARSVGESTTSDDQVPQELSAEVDALPARARRNSRIIIRENAAVVRIPMGEDVTVFVGYRLTTPPRAQSVMIKRTDADPIDITKMLASDPSRLPLPLLYRQAARLIDSTSSREQDSQGVIPKMSTDRHRPTDPSHSHTGPLPLSASSMPATTIPEDRDTVIETRSTRQTQKLKGSEAHGVPVASRRTALGLRIAERRDTDEASHNAVLAAKSQRRRSSGSAKGNEE